MNIAGKTCLLAVLFTLFVSGCLNVSQPGRKIDYYSLEYDPPLKAAERKQIPLTLRIKRFQVAPLYNSTRIIYRDKPFARNAYPNHKWRANPGDMVTFFLARDFEQAALLKAVFRLGREYSTEYLLEGTVDEFFEQDNSDSWEAVLGVSIVLLKEKEPDISKRILFQKRYQVHKACRQKTPQSFAAAMSDAMSSVSEMIINDVYDPLSKIIK